MCNNIHNVGLEIGFCLADFFFNKYIKQLKTYLNFLIQFFWIISFSIGIIRYKYIAKSNRILVVILGLIVFFEILARVFSLLSLRNYFLYNLLDLSLYFLLTFDHIRRFNTKSLLSFLLILVGVIFGIMICIDINNLSGLNYYLIYSALSIYSCYNIIYLSSNDEIEILNNIEFGFYTGLFVHCFSSISIYFLLQHFNNSSTVLYYYYKVYNLIIVTVANVLISRGFLCKKVR